MTSTRFDHECDLMRGHRGLHACAYCDLYFS